MKEVKMNLVFAINEYFQGEKLEALIFILSLGLLCLVFGVWLLTENSDFFKGVAIPFLLMGLVMTTVGGIVGFRTPSQVSKLESGLKAQKKVTIKAELERMEIVNKAWPKYLAIWISFGIIGLVLRILTKSDFFQGLGVALVFFSGVTLLIDGFAERRAVEYTKTLVLESQTVKN